MYQLNVWLTVKDPADVAAIRQHLTEQQRLSRLEPGCMRFEVYHSESDPRKFLLHEHWETKQAWEVHRTARAFLEIYQPHVLPKVDREPHVCELLPSV
jgi:quinol monooxygenase YgiN